MPDFSSPAPQKDAPRVLHIVGSLNQTTQLHAIARQMPDASHWFTPYYGDHLFRVAKRLGLIEQTIGGNKRSQWALDYLRGHRLQIDEMGQRGDYDLVVTSSDLIMPKNIRDRRVLVVQEGILDAENAGYHLCRAMPLLPRWLPGTSLTGLSGLYDLICVASEGYRAHLEQRGVPAHRIRVTGIPNFDHCRGYYDNSFPHRGYVLVCTSDGRETFKLDDRDAFLRKARSIAQGRQIIVKLHPNESWERSAAEVRAVLPEALVLQQGCAEEMVANCSVLICEWSTLIFVGMILGKECYSNFDLNEIRALLPVQNGGASARRIADICRELLAVPAEAADLSRTRGHYRFSPVPWARAMELT